MPKDTDSLKLSIPEPDSARASLGTRHDRRNQASRNLASRNQAWRDQSLDIAKGIGIILVVLGHCLDGLIASGFFPASVAWPALVVFVIYLFHMPLFFTVSGHLAAGKHRPVKSTLVKLFQTIVYPYFLWSVLEGLTLVYLSRYTTSHTHLSVLYGILWAPIVPYWFLYALFLCQAAYLITRRFPHMVQLGIAAVLFLAPGVVMHMLGRGGPLIIPETTRGFLYFTLGVVSVAQVKQFGRWTAISCTVLFALFATLYYQSHLAGTMADIAALPAGITGIISTLAWARMLASRNNWAVDALAVCGRYSMSIYVTHIFFTAGVRIALKRLIWVAPGAGPSPVAVCIEIVAAIVVGVTLPLAFNWMVSKFELDRWFGLQHMETA
jgi:fucose 4-O-acetylase-like acetyltransferase